VVVPPSLTEKQQAGSGSDANEAGPSPGDDWMLRGACLTDARGVGRNLPHVAASAHHDAKA